MEKVRIRLSDISKSYYSETAVTQALRKISLTFSEGEFVAITGESGSGKSTLLNIIGGMDTFDDGEMYIDGEPTFQYDDADWEDYRRSKIGYVFQDYSLVGHYSALDNVVSALLIMEQDLGQAQKTAMEYLRQVGLEGFEGHRASELSSGQKQRLSIARALAKNTGIIVADEPTGNLDTETGNQIIRLLKEISRDRLVIMVTHNYDQVEAYATRKLRLHEGEIISDVSGAAPEAALAGQAEEESGAEAHPAGQAEEGEEETHSAGQAEAEAHPVGQGEAPKASAGTPQRRIRHRNNGVAAYFAKLNRHTQRGRAFLFTSFLFVISVVSFLFVGELYQHADDTLTRDYDQVAFYREDNTRLTVRHMDGGAITNQDIARIGALPYVVTVDSCDSANDLNYYITEGEDYEYVYDVVRDWSGTRMVKGLKFLNEDNFLMSADCIDGGDLAAGTLPEDRAEIVLYSEDESLIGSSMVCYFTANNLWGQNHHYTMNVTVSGLLKGKSDQVYFSRELCRMLSNRVDSGYFRLYYNWDSRIHDYANKDWFVPIVADDLIGNQVRVTEDLQADGLIGRTVFHYEDIDEMGNEDGNAIEQIVDVSYGVHESTSLFLEVSQEFYDTYYDKESTQASVYLTSYAKTDFVMRALRHLGFDSMSTYRVSVTSYNSELTNNRLAVIGVCMGGLLALLLAGVLILRSLMKIRIKDYFVLKFIGMRMQLIKRISFYEIGAYSLMAVVLTILFMWLLRLTGIRILTEMMWYYRIDAYLVFIIYNLLLSALTVAAFNHLLKGRLKQ